MKSEAGITLFGKVIAFIIVALAFYIAGMIAVRPKPEPTSIPCEVPGFICTPCELHGTEPSGQLPVYHGYYGDRGIPLDDESEEEK